MMLSKFLDDFDEQEELTDLLGDDPLSENKLILLPPQKRSATSTSLPVANSRGAKLHGD